MWGFVGAGVGAAVAIGGAAYLAWGESRVNADELRLYSNCRGQVDVAARGGHSPSSIENMVGSGCYTASMTATASSPFFYGTSTGFEVTARGADVVDRTGDRATARVVGGILLGLGVAGAVTGVVFALTAPSEDETASENETSRDGVEVQVGFSPSSMWFRGSF